MGAKSLQSCLTLCDPMDCSLPGSSVHGDSLDKNTGAGCHALLQGSSLPRDQNPYPGIEPGSLSLLHWQVGSLPLAPTVQVDTATTYNVVNALKAWRGKPEILLVGVREDCQRTKDGVSS